jgi:phytoene dehydrogenase-like protein
LNPRVNRELALAVNGLKVSPPGGTALATAGGLLRFDGKGRAVEPKEAADGSPGITAADAAALRDIERFVVRLAGALAPLYEAPLPPLEALAAGDKLDLLKVGWRLRRLGRRDMQEAMRALPMSMRDFVEDRLAGEEVRALVAGLGSPGGWLGPYAAGTVFRALHDQMASPRPLLSGPVLPRGGMGALGEALAAAARSAGAEIRLESEVVRIDTDAGTARGVTLITGSHIEASAVVSDADPRRTLLELLDATDLTPEFRLTVSGMRARAGVALLSFGLDGLPEGAGQGGAAFGGRIQIGGRVADIERAFDDAPDGRLPQRPFVQLLFPTVADPGLADGGKHVATAWVQAVPQRLASADGDGWKDGRRALADAVVTVIDEALPGFSDRIVAHEVTAPPDLEDRFVAGQGCLYDADLGLEQALYLRPLPGWYGYRTPLAGLYLCGSGTHGGGGITGLAGRNAAQRVRGDLEARAARKGA